MSELPSGWIQSKISDAIFLNEKHVGISDDTECGFVPMALVPTGYGEPVKYETRTWDKCKKGFTQFKDNDVILAKITPCFENGKGALVTGLPNGIGAGSTEYFVLRTVRNLVEPKYIHAFVKTKEFLFNCETNMSGSVGHRRVPKDYLLNYPLPLAPLNEQKRIVEKLDEVLAQVDTIKARLDGIPAILKHFRQSVLAAAVSGKLTEEWRGSSNSSAENDLTKELLENTAKTRKVEQTSSHELVVNKFPSAWRKTTFTELYKFIDYRGKTPKKSENGFRLYTAKNIKMGFVSNEPVEYLSESDYEAWMTRGFSRLGDIFFVTEGHTMGCTAINDLGSEIALAQRTLTLQPYGNVNTRFHHYYMMSDSFQKLVDLNATGSAAKGIKAAKFRGLPLPFPSYEEQNEIVRLVEQYFAFAETIEAQVKKAQTRVDNLTQSILAKAFRGELVDQDPNDEPADKLLERIAAARKEAEALAKAAKKAQTAKKRTVKKESAQES